MSPRNPRVSSRTNAVSLRELFARSANRSGPRLGSTYMNVLRELRPDLHRQVSGTPRDPSADERHLNAFLLWVVDHWGADDLTIDVEVNGLVLW